MTESERRAQIRSYLARGYTYLTEGDAVWTQRRPVFLQDEAGHSVLVPSEMEHRHRPVAA